MVDEGKWGPQSSLISGGGRNGPCPTFFISPHSTLGSYSERHRRGGHSLQHLQPQKPRSLHCLPARIQQVNSGTSATSELPAADHQANTFRITAIRALRL